MNENITSSLNCPWSQYPKGSFPLCEEALCNWIRQPANTYSNIMFFICGLYLIYLYLKNKSQHGLGLGLCTLFIGMASFFAHASGTKFFGFFDFAAIFSSFSYYAAKNTIHLNKLKTKNVLTIFMYYYLPSAILIYFFGFLREIIFAIFVIGLLFSESKILRSQNKIFLVSSMKKLLLIFGFAVLFLVLDAAKIICDPNNHFFQMHALWHIFNAFSLYLLARHLDEHRSKLIID